MSQTLQSVLCITTNKYLVHVLVVLLHARFSVVGPIPFLLAAIFFSVHPYIGSTTVLPDYRTYVGDCVAPFFFFYGVRCAQYKVHAQCSFAALAPHMPCMLLVI